MPVSDNRNGDNGSEAVTGGSEKEFQEDLEDIEPINPIILLGKTKNSVEEKK